MSAEVHRLAEVARSLTADEQNRVEFLVQYSRLFCRAEVQALLDEHNSSPILYQYSCDCTPIRSREVHSTVGPAKQTSKFSTEVLKEFFVQQMFVTFGLSTEYVEKVVFPPPMVLSHGKSMSSLAAVSAHFLQGSWLSGSASGVTLFHQVHDGGMSLRFRQCISGHFEKARVEAAESTLSPESAAALSIHTEAPCCLHVAHNALRWAFETLYEEHREVSKLLFLGLGSLRSGTASALSFMHQ
eukprot:6477360-Amphidinium_carterae.1